MIKEPSIKYTTTIPISYIDTLKSMMEQNEIPSVNFAIREALGAYIQAKQEEAYRKQMQEAAQDKAFMNRTMKAKEAFKYADDEVETEW